MLRGVSPRSVLFVVAAADAMAAAMLLPILPYLGKATGLSLHWVTLCLAVFPATCLVSAFWLGRYADHHGARAALLVSTACASFGYVLLLLKPAVSVFIVSRMLCGFGAFTAIAAQAWLGNTADDAPLTRLMAQLALATGGGGIVGRAFGSWLAGGGSQLDLTVPVVAALLLAVTAWAGVAVGFQVSSPQRHNAEHSTTQQPASAAARLREGGATGGQLRLLFANRELRYVILLISLFSLANSVAVALLPAWLFDRHLVHSGREMMPVFVVPAVSYLIFQWMLTRQKMHAAPSALVLIGAFSVYAAGTLIVITGYARWGLNAVIAGFVINSLATATLVPLLQSLAYQAACENTRSRDLAFVAASAQVFTAIGIAIAGPLYLQAPDRPFWFALSAVMAALAVCVKRICSPEKAATGAPHEP